MQKRLYQKIMIVWGVLILAGYLTSFYYLDSPGWLLASWLSVGLVGIMVQYLLGGTRTKTDRWIQWLWISIVVGGSILTYLEYSGIFRLLTGMLHGWFYMCAGGYVLTGWLEQKKYYLSVASLYVIAGLSLYLFDLDHAILASGVYFFVLCVLDTFLSEKSRKIK
ncbi:hypothetical protein IT414_01670 [bacterium]|nr:hypothetical protein [bacterium]